MSSPDGMSPADIIELYQDNFVVSCIVYPVTALLLYDYLITLEEEVRLFWRRKITGASVLYFIIRYWTLITYDVLGGISFAHLSDTSCNVITVIQNVSIITQYIPWAAFQGLRVLALSGFNWPLSITVFILALGPTTVNLATFGYGFKGQNLLTTGCQEVNTVQAVDAQIFSAVSRSTLILADILVIIATIVKTRKRGSSELRRQTGRPLSIADVLVYNGMKYFIILLVLNLAAVILVHLSIATIAQNASYITQVSEPLTAIFISRFLLDLQAANQASTELNSQFCSNGRPDSLPPADSGTLVFALRMIGSIGSLVVPETAATDELEDYYCDEEGDAEEPQVGRSISRDGAGLASNGGTEVDVACLDSCAAPGAADGGGALVSTVEGNAGTHWDQPDSIA